MKKRTILYGRAMLRENNGHASIQKWVNSTWHTGRWYGSRAWLAGAHGWADRRRWGSTAQAGETGRCVWGERGLCRVALLALAAGRARGADGWAQCCLCPCREVIYGARQILQNAHTNMKIQSLKTLKNPFPLRCCGRATHNTSQ